MVLKYIIKTGSRIYGPPYTEAEEDDFYRRVGGGPITVARPASDRKASERDNDKHKQTTSKADPLLNSVLKVVSPYPCHRIEPLLGVDSRISR